MVSICFPYILNKLQNDLLLTAIDRLKDYLNQNDKNH